MSEAPKIRITADDLASIASNAPSAPAPLPSAAVSPGARHYGNIHAEPELASGEAQGERNILLEDWFYLGMAGLAGALIGWAFCEPFFIDGAANHWGNYWLLPAIVTLMCTGFGLAESIVERSPRKALIRTALALPLGLVFGFFFYRVANLIFAIGVHTAFSLAQASIHNPFLWIARGIAWAVFGVAGGAVYGIVGQSGQKARYGVLGGMLGAGLGGIIFDPISMPFHSAVISRMIGFALFGCATGVAMGLVESALKDRWLYVAAGPLAGKQFILYKPLTSIGSQQIADIYLFKDATILPEHAVIEARGNRLQVRALGPVYVGGQPIHSRVLEDGDLLQIGRYSFRFKEKKRA